MSDPEKQKPRNSSYLFEEGNCGGGPDCGSSASSSSAGSGMKFITTKLKPKGRVRILILGLVVVIVIILVAAIATAVYFTSGSKEETPKTLRQYDTEDRPGATVSTTLITSTSSNVTSNSSSDPTSSITQFPISSKNSSTETTPVPETTTPFVDTTEPSNATVEISDVLYHPEDVKSLTLKCQGRHLGDWNTLTLRRQFHDSYEPIAVVTKNEAGEAAVIVFYPNVTHRIVVRNYEITLILIIDPFYCEQLTNFTCAMDTEEGVVSAGAKISVFMPGVEMQLPHSVVEDLLISLQCTVDVFETNASVLWKFKPNGADDFMDFSVAPVTEITKKDACTYHINSTLTFTTTMYENGSDFRCEVIAPWWNPSLIQDKSAGAVLHVLPKTFCDNKRQFSIHAHPNGPCTRVIYCLNTGPLVYEIDCEPGFCYDTSKTTCVSQVET